MDTYGYVFGCTIKSYILFTSEDDAITMYTVYMYNIDYIYIYTHTPTITFHHYSMPSPPKRNVRSNTKLLFFFYYSEEEIHALSFMIVQPLVIATVHTDSLVHQHKWLPPCKPTLM